MGGGKKKGAGENHQMECALPRWEWMQRGGPPFRKPPFKEKREKEGDAQKRDHNSIHDQVVRGSGVSQCRERKGNLPVPWQEKHRGMLAFVQKAAEQKGDDPVDRCRGVVVGVVIV